MLRCSKPGPLTIEGDDFLSVRELNLEPAHPQRSPGELQPAMCCASFFQFLQKCLDGGGQHSLSVIVCEVAQLLGTDVHHGTAHFPLK